ncbi:hypothetical protein NDU88_005046 [Pleurodeles waltl]|uniref:Uncharacterized protein n=1 Tax=Pleurodeles waltl TaxID=8319 RepID=A0AAV7UH18_PLEWA|nr:hypothetical protein NDU88_005046 [Pleurodeles waltl]
MRAVVVRVVDQSYRVYRAQKQKVAGTSKAWSSSPANPNSVTLFRVGRTTREIEEVGEKNAAPLRLMTAAPPEVFKAWGTIQWDRGGAASTVLLFELAATRPGPVQLLQTPESRALGSGSRILPSTARSRALRELQVLHCNRSSPPVNSPWPSWSTPFGSWEDHRDPQAQVNPGETLTNKADGAKGLLKNKGGMPAQQLG